MNTRMKKTWVAATVVAAVVSAAGIAGFAGAAGTAGRDITDYYEGDNNTVADPNRTAVALTLYDATGAPVTTGAVADPLPTYAGAGAAVRPNDDNASLFVHPATFSTAPAAWPGVQATGTSKFSGAGAVTAPASVGSGKPFVATAGGYSLADVAGAFANTETSPSFAGVYELRLRTSSATAGLSDTYAATWLKVTGTTWSVTTAPVLGEQPPAAAVDTTVTPTWPARITYGTAASVTVKVAAATGTATPTGSVSLVSGSKTLSTAPLSAAGTATLSVARTALAPGSRSLQVTYGGVTGAFNPSTSAAKTFAVAKRAPGKPTWKVTKTPTAKKGGSAAITVPTTAGLAKAAGKAVVTLKKGSTTKKVTVTIAAGKGTAKLPKLPAGTWTVTVTYAGNAYYLPATSKAYKLRTKAK